MKYRKQLLWTLAGMALLTGCRDLKINKVEPADSGSSRQESAEYSDRTVIISVDDQFSAEDLEKILTAYNLTVVYDYTSFNGYALQTAESYTDKKMNELVEQLARQPHVLNAQRDGINQLNDAGQVTE